MEIWLQNIGYKFSVSLLIFVKSGKILTFELFRPADDRSCRRIWHVLELPPVGIIALQDFLMKALHQVR